MDTKKENLRKSSYMIPIKLEDGKYMLLHGYTGSIDVVNENILTAISSNELDKLNPSVYAQLKVRGYLTLKTKEEEYAYVERLAHAFHEKDKKLYKNFTVLVTYNCNFRCPYCFENRRIKDSDHQIVFTRGMVDKMYAAIEEIETHPELRSNIITLYGGEPLLKENKGIVDYIVKQGTQKGYKFHAVTNGYDLDSYMDLLTPEYITNVQITIDGTKDIHNEKRKHYLGLNTFDKIISNIQQVLPQGCRVSVRVNVDNRNASDFIQLKNYLESIGLLGNENFTFYSAIINDNESISKQDEVEVLSAKSFIDNHLQTDTISLCNNYGVTYRKLHDAIKNKKPIPFKATYCGAQTSGYVFSPLGEIFPCWEVVGNVCHQIGSYSTIPIQWEQEEIKKWRNSDVVSSSSCKYCKFALLCGGRCMAFDNNNCVYFQAILRKAANNAYKHCCTI